MKKIYLLKKRKKILVKAKPSTHDSEKCSESGGNGRFLKDKIVILSKQENTEIVRARNTKLKKGQPLSVAKPTSHTSDIKNLSPNDLRLKYTSTYDSWRNMKQRAKLGYTIAPQFASFATFLFHMGPRPHRSYTLDRLDVHNRTYGPGLCEWRDKKAQANNRTCTIYLTYDNETLPLTVWAARTKQKPDTLRSRKTKGWSDAEIIFGKKSIVYDDKDFYESMWPDNSERVDYWENSYLTNKYENESRVAYLMQHCRKELSILDAWYEENYIGDDDYANGFVKDEEYLKKVKQRFTLRELAKKSNAYAEARKISDC
jgi:hypothetical protein